MDNAIDNPIKKRLNTIDHNLSGLLVLRSMKINSNMAIRNEKGKTNGKILVLVMKDNITNKLSATTKVNKIKEQLKSIFLIYYRVLSVTISNGIQCFAHISPLAFSKCLVINIQFI